MEKSILQTVKKVCGLAETYTAFDPDLVMFINTAFSTLQQLGVGPLDGYFIEDETAEWDELAVPPRALAMIGTYVTLKARNLFDPPTTSYLIDATERQIAELEWRISNYRELTQGGIQ